MSDIRVGT